MQGNKDHKNLSNMQGFKEKNPDLTVNKSFKFMVRHVTYILDSNSSSTYKQS